MIEKEERRCAVCGQIPDEHEGTTVCGDTLCDSCRDEQCVHCEHCDGYVYREDSVCDSNYTLCLECYNDHYYRCAECGRILHNDEVSWGRNDEPYCDSCYNDDYEIEDYSYKPEPIFYGSDSRYFGIELEVDNAGKYDDNALAIKNCGNSADEHIYIKSDGSLDDGFEIVSHPMTLDYHMNEMNWQEVLAKAIQLGYKSHQTSTCGLHIHVNRKSLGEYEYQQEEVISKILFFVEKHWNEIFAFSRRREHDIKRWAARYGFEKTGKEIMDKAKSGSQGRYSAVNLANYTTIEFRIFRGTLKYNTFIAAMQLVNEICNAAFYMSENELDKQSWSDFVKGITHKELIQYLKERRLYVNDSVETEEDV